MGYIPTRLPRASSTCSQNKKKLNTIYMCTLLGWFSFENTLKFLDRNTSHDAQEFVFLSINMFFRLKMRSKIIASVDRLFEPTNMFMDKNTRVIQ